MKKHSIKRMLKTALVSVMLLCLAASSMPIAQADAIDPPDLHIEDITIQRGTSGEFIKSSSSPDEAFTPWFSYNYLSMIKATAVYDGVEYVSDGINFFDVEFDDWLSISDSQSSSTPWDIGEHTVTATLANHKASTTFTVTIVDNDIDKIEIDDIDIVEGTCIEEDDWYDSDNDESFWYEYYNFNSKLNGKVTLKDGREFYLDSRWVEIDDEDYHIELADGQSYFNHWQKGAHKVTAYLLGVQTTFTVNITDSPVKELKVQDVECIEGTNGNWYNEDGGYFVYEPSPNYTVTMKDGTKIEDSGSSFEYEGSDYRIIYTYENSGRDLKVGTHKAEANLLGVKAQFNLKINETPVKSVKVDDVTVIENYDGIDWDDYFEYIFSPEFTVTLKDGTEIRSEFGDVLLDGNYYSLRTENKQSPDNQWYVGKHTVKGRILGCSTEFSVNVIKCPVKELRFEPVKLYKDFSGQTEKDYDDEDNPNSSYFRYNYDFNEGEVVLNDGTTLPINSGSVEFNGKSYSIDTADDQSAKNPWDIGKHKVKASVLGYETETEVEVCESPVASVDILSVKPLTEQEYYRGVLIMKFKVTMKDGTSFCEYINSKGGYPSSDKYKVENDKDKTLEFYINYLGVKASWKVEIIADEDFTYFEQDGGLYITGCGLNDKEVTIPSEIDGKKVVGILSLEMKNDVETLNIPDSVTSLGETLFAKTNKLTTINIGKGVTNLSENMFKKSMRLTAINVSKDNPALTSIDGVVFDKKVETVVAFPIGKTDKFTVPASVKSFELLDECNMQLEFEDGSKNYKTVGDVTYSYDMTRIVHVNDTIKGDYVMPDTVKKVPPQAFMGKENLETVKISKNVTDIEYRTFLGCRALKSVSIPSGVRTIGDNAFTRTALSELTLPENLESVGNSSFYGTNIKKLEVPAKVKEIGNSAFASDTNLSEVKLNGENVKVGKFAFRSCPISDLGFINKTDAVNRECYESNKAVTKVEIGKTVTEICYGSFNACSSLEDVSIDSSIIKVEGLFLEKTKWRENQKDGDLYVDGVYYGYKGDIPENYALNLKNGTKTIADQCFFNMQVKNITSVTLPEGIKRIGALSLSKTSIKEITIPASVEEIGESAFAGCANLTAINVSPDNKYYTSVDGVLYSKDMKQLIYCPKRAEKTYVVPNSVKEILPFAFDEKCVEEVEIANPNTRLDNYAIGADIVPTRYSYKNYTASYYLYTAIACPKDSQAAEFAFENQLDTREIEPSETPTEPASPTVPIVTEPVVTEPVVTEPTPTVPTPTEKPASAKKPRLIKTKATLSAGKTASIIVLNKGNSKPIFRTSKSAIAKVSSSGKVTALRKGSAKITVTVGKTKLYFEVKVKSNPYLSKKTLSIKKGKSKTVRIYGKASGTKNTYTNAKTAKIKASKTATKLKVKGIKKGKGTLKIKVNGFTLKLLVTVK